MTTTLRPDGPELRAADGGRSRAYTVCVNSRPVGGVELRVDPKLGPSVGRIEALAVQEPDRRRGRGAVAALAAEEVLRLWGCARVEASVPAEAEYALRLAVSLGYLERNRHMLKDLDAGPHPLPPGSVLRPLTEDEYEPWRAEEAETFTALLVDCGIPRDEAEARQATAFADVLPDGRDTPGTALLALDHDGVTVGRLWVRVGDRPWVFSVRVEAAHRGHGHGRTLMLGAENTCRAAGATTLGLNVLTANTPALRLYESLGYRTTLRHFAKPLL
ncbi:MULTISPECIES: GNAT family N-acetyltransferase [unclassified Streptomyces]|uniref:GNAT family N-acetyltransferase n=1 Tax=unclassified Streptomyces TaxID=2593676 RepID=UPI002E2DFE9A|nr:GNAT family N-acetyltransferase [Streptomyces sp. NBC_00223]